MYRLNSRMKMAEERASGKEKKSIIILKSEEQRKKFSKDIPSDL